MAVAVWGRSWRSTTVQVFSDNIVLVSALSWGSARDPLLMHLLHCLHFFANRSHSWRTKHYSRCTVKGNVGKILLLPPGTKCTFQSASTPAGHAAQITRRDITRLEDTVSKYLTWALQAYGSGHRCCITFCTQAGLSPLSLTEHKLCMFVAHMGSQALASHNKVIFVSCLLHAGHCWRSIPTTAISAQGRQTLTLPATEVDVPTHQPGGNHGNPSRTTGHKLQQRIRMLSCSGQPAAWSF